MTVTEQRVVTFVTDDNQEAFEIVVDHLLHLPYRNMDDEGSCSYSAGPGCAIAPLLDCDHETKSWLDDEWGSTDISTHIESGRVDPGQLSPRLLSDLQTTHDREGNWGEHGFSNLGHLRTIAAQYGLTPPPALWENDDA